MPKPTNREEFKEYCLRALGYPVIEINVDEDQVQDRIDEAIQWWQDYHYDALEHCYFKYNITSVDYNNRWIPIPDNIIGVKRLLPWDDTRMDMFDIRYQMALNSLPNYFSMDLSYYATFKSYVNLINQVLAGAKPIEFKRHQNRLYMFNEWSKLMSFSGSTITQITVTNAGTGYTSAPNVIVQSNGTTVTAVATLNSNGGVGTITVTAGGDNYSAASLPPVSIVGGGGNGAAAQATVGTRTIVVDGYKVVDLDTFPDVWNDLWLKRMATAMIKRQWGINLSKFTALPLPSGIQLNGPAILAEALAEIKEIETNLINSFSEPPDFFVG